MINNIIRTFHPVGQGAFYSERINGFNLVYDCGTCSDKSGGKKVVKQSFTNNDDIDMLVISHFDEDHVNLIPILKETVRSIKTVIYPLMSPMQKAYILSSYEDKELYNIVLKPNEYFEGAKIIWVKPSNEEWPNNIDERPYSMEALANVQEINSGRRINPEGATDWVFIPYNYDDGEKSKIIKGLFAEKFKDDKEFDIDNIADTLSNPHVRSKIRRMYKTKDIGGTNENSLLMYSGPIKKGAHCFLRYSQRPCCHFCYHNIFPYAGGCLYTGDATIEPKNLTWINEIKNHYDVGTIQISHHGSIKSWSNSLLDKGLFCCVISVGKNNTHRHPSGRVLEDILLKNMHPILVTDDPTTCFVEYIIHP